MGSIIAELKSPLFWVMSVFAGTVIGVRQDVLNGSWSCPYGSISMRTVRFWPSSKQSHFVCTPC